MIGDGKGEVPLVRILVRHNKVVDTLMQRQDFGGMMAEQATTATGKISNLTDAITRFQTVLGSVTTGPVGDLAAGLADIVNVNATAIESFQRGDITIDQVRSTLFKYQTMQISAADAIGELNAKQIEQQERMKAAMEAAQGYNEGLSEAERASARFGNTLREEVIPSAEDMKAALEANENAVKYLQGLISGGLDESSKEYAQTQEDLKIKAAELGAEIDKLNAKQGQQYTVTRDSGLSTAELTLAQEKLAAAQAKLSEETDPLKQAQLAVQIENLQEKISGANVTVTGYIDNSKQIGELQAEYDQVTAAIQINAAAHDDANKRIIFNILQQQLAVDGYTTEEVLALTKQAEAWGLIDRKTAEATQGVVSAVGYAQASGNWDALNARLDVVKDKLDRIPRDIPVNIRVTSSGQVVGTLHEEGEGGRGGRQHGGPVMGGSMYLVGERGPEYFIPASNGRVTPMGDVNNTNMGGVTIVVNGSGNPQAVAAEVRRQLDASGRSADGRIRMR